MSGRSVGEVSSAQVRDAIEIIATAEKARSQGLSPTGQTASDQTDAQVSQLNRPLPQGHDAVVDKAMGSVELPSLIDLKNSVQQIRDGLVAASDISVEISSTVLAVMDEELLKIDRYVELRDR